MTPSTLSVYCTNAAMLMYLFATVFYILYFINKKRWLYIAAPVVAILAILPHGTALIDRWIQGGLYRPPGQIFMSRSFILVWDWRLFLSLSI